MQSSVPGDDKCPSTLSNSKQCFFENYIWVQKLQDVCCSNCQSVRISCTFVAVCVSSFCLFTKAPFCCTLTTYTWQESYKLACSHFFNIVLWSNGFPAVQQWHWSSFSIAEGHSFRGIKWELINHYCKVSSDLSCYCSLSSGKSKHRDDGLHRPKID